jgi:hypothetical protein
MEEPFKRTCRRRLLPTGLPAAEPKLKQHRSRQVARMHALLGASTILTAPMPGVT